MSVENLEIDTAILLQNIETIRQHLDTMRKNLTEMFASAAELDKMWDGPANEAFKAQYVYDLARFQAYCSSVEELLGCMSYAAKEYDTCESNVKASIDALRF